MGLFARFLIGAVVGAAAGFAVAYLFGPTPGTTYDANYRSRLDRALEEGDKAAAEYEADLRRQLEEAKQGIRRLPDNRASGSDLYPR
jgi:gas vesicle protein